MAREQCEYRLDVTSDANGIEFATCELARIISNADTAACLVRGDACQACLRAATPSPEQPNYVVASLLVGVSQRLSEPARGLVRDRALNVIREHQRQQRIEQGKRAAAEKSRGFGDTLHKFFKATGIASAWKRLKGVKPTEDCSPCEQRRRALNKIIPYGKPPAQPKSEQAQPSNDDKSTEDDRQMKWAYGLTTVPSRLNTTLPRTLASLERAGFPAPRLFIDGCDDVKPYEKFQLEMSVRYPKVKAWGNWFLGMSELFIRYPEADRYAMFQDDFITCRNLRAYLTACKWPSDGYMNLYTFPEYQDVAPDKIGWYSPARSGARGKKGLGALALVFTRQALMKMLAFRGTVYKPTSAAHNKRSESIDGACFEAMFQCGWTEYVHNPSLVQHIGFVSSMGHGRFPQATTFLGEDFDAMDLLAKPTKTKMASPV